MPAKTSDAMTSLVHRLIPPLVAKASAPLSSSMALYALQLKALQSILDQTGRCAHLDQWLTEGEQQLFSSFSLQKRRLEWLGGRITAKVSLLSLLGDDDPLFTPNRLEILPDRTGRPHLTGLGAALPEKISLSISHSGSQAAAMASRDRPCGLDIQQLSPALKGIKERFSSATERRFLQSCPQLSRYNKLEQLALLWSAKEAIRKALLLSPLPGLQEIHLTGEPRPEAGAFHLAAALIRNGKQWNFSVISWLENDMAMAITLL
ncbi:MAG: 4'-phosphopantetheinyl transferase superfamily protein [Deltaproteobacteria bacterium]